MSVDGETASGSGSLTSILAARGECCKLSARYRVRRIRSKGAVLVLLWSVAGYAALAVFPTESPLSSLRPFEGFQYVIEVLALLIPLICSPLAGLLGDAYIGRHRLLQASVFLMWIAAIVYTVVFLVESLYPGTSTALNYSVILLANILFLIGVSGFQVLLIMFGVDQLPDASTEEVSAFLHWLIWTWFLGLCIGNAGYLVYDCESLSAAPVVVLVSVSAISFILCTDYLCKSWLVIEPRCQNPMKNITGVLRFAFTHKHPVRRSALTYWEDKIPSRMDLGKTKYGGPFTNEQVEDVKTFFRVIIVTVCILAFVIPVAATRDAVTQTTYYYKYSYVTTSCYNSFDLYILVLQVLYIPIYEFIVYPLARNWIPSSLVRVVIFALLTVAVCFYLMLLDIVGQSQADTNVPCMFQADKTTNPLPIHYFAVEIPTGVLIALQWLAFVIAAFEFICAQSPYNMKGLLTGLATVVIVLASRVGSAIYKVWSDAWKDSDSAISCGTWYYIFTSLLGITGLIFLFVVAKWYKRRERDDIINEQRFAEAYYASHDSQY